MFAATIESRTLQQVLFRAPALAPHHMSSIPVIIIAKLTYAASAWRGFTKASGRQRIDALLRRSKLCGYYALHLPIFEELCENIDDQLFNKTVENSNHVLHSVPPPSSIASQHYNRTRRTHSLSLPDHDNYMSDCNFITRMLYKQCYKVLTIQFYCSSSFALVVRIVQLQIGNCLK